MSIIPTFFLSMSFFLLFFNGSALGFILFNERFDSLFGYGFFIFTCLVGAVFASIAEEPGTAKKFYCRYCLYGNLLVVFFPLYFHWVSDFIFPRLVEMFL
ncbi:hypothetical protein [Bacillus sinesaloumensis]|uniref:hypothetical protein n=1 Tax=Litchfieldia sinesaloumensis TaxID=1926280 RepID=UPI0009886250|nr:hypothetical protein [Bacillus sinesaloumensis]